MCGVAESEGEHSWCDAMGEMQKGALGDKLRFLRGNEL